MSIERAIQHRWSRWEPLTRLVPVERFVTGLMPPRDGKGQRIELPYVTLHRSSAGAEVIRTSSGTRLVREELEIRVYGKALDATKRIAKTIERSFERADFDWPEGQIQDMRLMKTDEEPAADAAWKLTLHYQVRYSKLERNLATRS